MTGTRAQPLGHNAHGAGRGRARPAGRHRSQPGRAGEPAGAQPVLRHATAGPDQVKPTSRSKCPSLRWSTPPPAQCTMNASRMMARITTTTQKKNTTMPGTAYPATVLALATATSYPPPADLFGGCFGKAGRSSAEPEAGRRVQEPEADADRPVRPPRTKSGPEDDSPSMAAGMRAWRARSAIAQREAERRSAVAALGEVARKIYRRSHGATGQCAGATRPLTHRRAEVGCATRASGS